jgi:alcohol dehydrogenase class IV
VTGAGFIWHDGERTIRFGRGVAAEAVELLGGPGYTLLTTERTAKLAPHVVEAAAAVHHVAHGLVEDVAGDLLAGPLSPGPEPLAGTAGAGSPVPDAARDRSPVPGTDDVRASVSEAAGARIVALGGGRVIDVAKSLAAARTAAGSPTRALAVPTTLSGAEMSGGHRIARGAAGELRVRCAVVVNDPALSASQPLPGLAASAANALGHAATAPCTRGANPVATLAALEAARGIAGAFGARSGEPDRDALALAALLAGYALDSAGLGLHHVLAQTLVRVGGAPHAQANTVMLPHTLAALAWRFPAQAEALTEALGDDPVDGAGRLARLAGAEGIRALGIEPEALARCADVAAERAELDATPPRADRAELLAIYESAW